MSFRQVVAEHKDDPDDSPEADTGQASAPASTSPFLNDYQTERFALDTEGTMELASVLNTTANVASLLL